MSDEPEWILFTDVVLKRLKDAGFTRLHENYKYTIKPEEVDIPVPGKLIAAIKPIKPVEEGVFEETETISINDDKAVDALLHSPEFAYYVYCYFVDERIPIG